MNQTTQDKNATKPCTGARPANVSAACLALSMVSAAAPSIGAERTDSVPAIAAAAAPDGFRWGSFLARPEMGVSTMYDSNIFATRNREVDDAVGLLTPALDVTSQWARNKLHFNGGATSARYSSVTSEDYDDYWSDVDGRLDIGARSNLFGGLGYSREHEDRSSPDATLAGKKPTSFTSEHAHGGIAHSWGRWSARLGGTFESLNFGDEAPINNDDRDRDMLGLGLRLNYRINPRYAVFGQAIRDERRYERPFDDYGFKRDSEGNRLGIGFTGVFSNRLSGGAQVGYLSQDYHDAAFSNLDTVDFSGQLTYRASPRTNLVASVERTLEETTLPGSSGYLNNAASLEAVHRITARLRATLSVTAANEDYRGIGRDDDIYGAEFGLRYTLTPRYYLAASYRLTTRNSNQREAVLNTADVQNLDDYGRQQIFFTLGALLYPLRDTGLAALPGFDVLPMTTADWGGFYLGGQLTHGSSTFRSDGLRGDAGHGGTDESAYGDAGFGGGLFAGYGRSFDRWYVGIEAEAERASTDIAHSNDKLESLTLAVDRGDSYALSLLGGYHLAGGELLYLRLGRVRTDFDTFFTVNDAPQDAIDTTYEQDGTRYGVGTDIPIDSRLFVRMDYSHTTYDKFRAGTDTFDPAESYFRLGVGWKFDAPPSTETPIAPVDAKGFYAGATMGHQALTSNVTGIQKDKSGSSNFQGDFGDAGGVNGGAFAGWGASWGRWYGGLEATAETSTADWQHVREPTGRDFSVEKHETYGLGLRGGYQLASGTLLYLHADRLRTRFGTRWSKGDNRSNDVDRDDRVDGTRIGVGADLPLTRALFLRMDYSYTDYDDYRLTTTHGSPDSMRFDNAETLFRLGLGARF